MNLFYDDCHCPAGVAERIQAKIALFKIVAIATIVTAICKGAIALFEAASRAARHVDWGAAATIGLGIFIGAIALFAIFIATQTLKDEPAENALEGVRWLRRAMMERDIERRMRARPELSTMTIDDILRDQEEHHDEEEQVTSPTYIQDYTRAWRKTQARLITNN